MFDRLPPPVLLGAYALVLGVCAHWLTAPLEAPPGPAPVAPKPPAETKASPQTRLLGVVVNSSTVDVLAPHRAIIRDVLVRVGDEVKAGQVLVTLDNDEIRRELDVQRAQLSIDEAELSRAKLELEQATERQRRIEGVSEHLNVDEVGSARFAVASATATLRSVTARREQGLSKLSLLTDRLKRTELRAVAAGSVADRFLDPGAVVVEGTPVLRVVGSGGLVRFAIPEQQHVVTGATLKVEVSPTENHPAVVTAVSPVLDPASNTRIAEARFTGTTSVAFGSQVRVVVVPP